MRRGPRTQRGASGVEYALLAAVIALGTLGAIDFLEDAGTAKANRTAEAISQGSAAALPVSCSFMRVAPIFSCTSPASTRDISSSNSPVSTSWSTASCSAERSSSTRPRPRRSAG